MTYVSPEGWNDYGSKHPLLQIQVGCIVWTYVIDTEWQVGAIWLGATVPNVRGAARIQ